jgi:peptide/nickel transport system ATP-binding protein
MGETPLLRFDRAGRDFDISAPWLDRMLSRQGRQRLIAVDEMSFEIARGETFALVGESGCGKSTVGRMAVGLIRPSRGSILFAGAPVSGAGQTDRTNRPGQMQMIFQDPHASLNPRWRVGDIIAEPLMTTGWGNRRAETRERVDELLLAVGLSPEDARRFPHEFSGGQRQRISIARALSSSPDFIVCDEPTSALDVSVQAQVLNLMQDLQARFRLTYLFISHNLAVVEHMADRIGVMYLGRLVETGPASQVLAEPAHPYTRMLLTSLPDTSLSGRQKPAVTGEIPNPAHRPGGCDFNPRCTLASGPCKTAVPASRAVGEGWQVACHAADRRPNLGNTGD